MKKAILLAACMMFGSAHATLIDFEGFGASQFVSNQVSGVTISSFENGVDTGLGGFLMVNGDPWSGLQINGNGVLTNCLTATCQFAEENRADVLRLNFDNFVDNLSLIFDGDGGLSTFNAYDSNGNLLESVMAASEPTTVNFTASAISYLDVLQQFDNFAYSIDDLSFDAVDVPEPSSIAVLALGLLGLGANRIRKAA